MQVGPILVDPGGKVGIYTNQGDRRRRSAICLRPGEVVAIVVDGDGLSLFQLANLLAIPIEKGGVGCDAAINLDGGPSTQAIYRGGGRRIAIDGESTVQNALVVSVPGPVARKQKKRGHCEPFAICRVIVVRHGASACPPTPSHA